MRKRLRLLILVALLALVIPHAALAAPGPGTNNCWGTVVSQRASYYHDIGIHSPCPSPNTTFPPSGLSGRWFRSACVKAGSPPLRSHAKGAGPIRAQFGPCSDNQ